MKNWQHYWKSVLAFLSLVVTNAVTDLMQSGNPWPSNGGEWARWAATVVGGTLLVYGKGNAPKKPVDTPPVDAPAAEPTVRRKRRPVI